jgi:hypothetical protein
MGVSSVLLLPASTESQVETGQVRPTQAAPQPVPELGPSAESGDPQVRSSGPNVAEDAVKVQWQPPGETPVYQFLDQNGTLVLQVPPQQALELARDISQELAQEEAPKKVTGDEGGADHGR